MKTAILEQFNEKCSSRVLFEDKYPPKMRNALRRLKILLFPIFIIGYCIMVYFGQNKSIIYLFGISALILIAVIIIYKRVQISRKGDCIVLARYYNEIVRSPKKLPSVVKKIRIKETLLLIRSCNLSTVRKVDYLIKDFTDDLKETSQNPQLEQIASIPTILSLLTLCPAVYSLTELKDLRVVFILGIAFFLLWALLMRAFAYLFFSNNNKKEQLRDLLFYLKEARTQLLSEEQSNSVLNQTEESW
ncbi:hypothetical protein [Chitinophaga sp. HK235]|uniref:hypothetical protein n=1 Tax=Chitinophaga sp. HK235 TaxID=2952571 RepID=UPI001BA6512D|nr:hypothetical protein [Chitinophaga sp. HK235]